MPSSAEVLRRLAIGDRALIASASTDAFVGRRLDAMTEALIRVVVLVPLDAPQSSYQGAVEGAMRAGASLDDLVAALLAVVDAVGAPRVVAAAPRIALAAGYDVDGALEEAPRPVR